MLLTLKWYYYWFRYLFRNKFPKLYRMFHLGFTKHPFLSPEEANTFISQGIQSKTPLMVCRIGANESFTMRTYTFHHVKNYQKALRQLCDCAGFFPNTLKAAQSFVDEITRCMHNMDLCGTLLCPMDDYFIQTNAPSVCKTTLLGSIDSTDRSVPWTSLLRGKKVLVVHPFAQTIQQQYQKRELLFPGRNVLPEFHLITYKAVQTAAGQTDERFSSWFEALEYMAGEISHLDYDIALLGCGAYGLPLASRIKQQGKQAIQIGGSLQILFGIKGRRWDNDPGTTKFYNDAWVYPLPEETPSGSDIVENSCYWK